MITLRQYRTMIHHCLGLARTNNPEWNARWLRVAEYLKTRQNREIGHSWY